MKKILFTLVFQTLCFWLMSQSPNIPSGKAVFYYYKGKKIYFSQSQDKVVIGMIEGKSVNDLKSLFLTERSVNPDSIKLTAVRNQYILKVKNGTISAVEETIASSLKSSGNILYIRPLIVGINGKSFSYGNDFVVKLKTSTTENDLLSFIQKQNCTLSRKYLFNDKTFIIGAGKANNYDALNMANLFYESGLFEYAEPDFEMYDAIDDAPNDPLYYLQWDHKNTGSSAQYNGTAGADMNVDSAWLITKGKSNITVAVMDVGVDTAHPDLKANLMQGFDCISLSSNKGDGRPLSNNNGHGTCCAGIIAAIENSVGIAGIAPNCKLMPINLADASGNFTTESNIAAGLDYAWQHGADVITNSWGGGSPSNLIDDAIHRCVTQGRSGKGCTMFFSAGNNNAGLSYPAMNSEVMAIGGINMCNQRKSPNSCDGEDWWGASYGYGLALAAPCVKIPTTDLSGAAGYDPGNYFRTFNGTSAACPHAAAVAALVLSVNPLLTQEDVKTILDNTADKIPGYNFKMTIGYKNGTWNNELGYGRVDAYHAVLAAKSGKYCNAEIQALSQVRFCNGDSVKMAVINPDANMDYNWYQDNMLVKANALNFTAKKTAAYKIIAVAPNGCTAISPSISVTAVIAKAPLIANAGSDISYCNNSSGARIGGLPSAMGGAAFLNKKRVYSMDWYSNNFYRYSLNNPGDVDTVVAQVMDDSDFKAGNFFAAGDFTPFGYYALTRATNKLIRIDTINGAQQLINVINPKTGNWQGLAWDASSNQLYAMSSFGTQSELYKLDLFTGAAQFIAYIPLNYLVWIAVDNNGNMYALSNDTKYIYSINKQTGAATALPQIGDSGFDFAQDADFDPLTDSLYLSAFTARQNFVGDLRMADTGTGAVSSIGIIGTTPLNEMDATGIAGYTYKYKWAPATGLSDQFDANPLANPAKTTTYTLTVTDICGSQASAQVKVITNLGKPAVNIKAPATNLCSGRLHLSATASNGYIYQWYWNDTAITNANDSFYNATVAGNYTVHAYRGEGGCDSLSNVFVVNKCPNKTAVASFISTEKNIYTLYPNPAKNIINIQLPQSLQPSVLFLYDMNGKAVISKKINQNNSTEKIDISRLSAGIYRVVWQQNQKHLNWKFVKQ